MSEHTLSLPLTGCALITGASSGIGATYAQKLAARGHNLILVARDQTKLEALAVTLRAQHAVQVEVFPADLLDPAALRKVEARLAADAAIGVLVNNAGVAVQGPLTEVEIDAVERMLQLNIVVPTRLAAAAGKAFAARGAGCVINIGSVTAFMAERFSGTYSGTKAYMLNLSQSMAAELGPRGVRVQAVLPGVTRTAIWEAAALAQLPAEMVMEVGDMVDAALAGLALGERVTIPSLPEAADFAALEAARHALFPNLSRRLPAQRYGVRGD